jgi:cephalosporin hydroxylase
MNRKRARLLAIGAVAVVLVVVTAGVLVLKTTRGAEAVARALRPILVPAFAVLYHSEESNTWLDTKWQGHQILKNPMDLWSYQEIIQEIKPDWIIECGTYHGASALYFANMLDLVGKGGVITFDVEDWPAKPLHPRIQYFLQSSTSDEALQIVRERVKPGDVVMVSLDSLHTRDHVFRELQLYSPFVTRDSYLIVEDTNLNGHPVYPHFGPGPGEAVRDFLQTTSDFQADDRRERFLLTFNPGGYLKRVK